MPATSSPVVFAPDTVVSSSLSTIDESQLIWLCSTIAAIVICFLIGFCSYCIRVDLFVIYLNKAFCKLPRTIGFILMFLSGLALFYGNLLLLFFLKFFFFF